ncbi:MAG TPA: glycosyltransferase [Myxococcales bacterium]|nr:glycosyltransferase [Myxococcales bacterium]
MTTEVTAQPFRPCAIIPTFENPSTIRAVVEKVRALLPDVIVVDDGSAPEGRAQVEQLGREKLAHALRREINGGKGAAVKTGFQAAHELGYTHALQIDADGQHDLGDIPRFLEAARKQPEALVLGCPVFDGSAPLGRRVGRQITVFWSSVETGSRAIVDPMCGYRVYPLKPALAASHGTGDRMEFDPEIAVRMVWAGVPTVNLRTRVRYLRREEGGVSHFHLFRDNVRITWMHTRLVTLALLRLLLWPLRGPRRTRERTWLSAAEAGSVFGIRFLVLLCTVFGRSAARAALRPVVLYYVLFHASARSSSREYLKRAVGRASWRMIYRHFLNFAEVALDRFFLLKGQFHRFQVGSDGFQNLKKLQAERRGAILLGAHIGSFEAMRLIADSRDLPINVITYRGNAKKLNAVLRSINPAAVGRFVELAPGDVSSVFRIRELIEAGELVAVLGDRADLDPNLVLADFLGAKARFPASLYVLAAVLGCPIYLTFSIYRSPDRYDCYCELFAERVELRRGHRDEGIAEYVQRYAQRLEHYCRMEPCNWFNFFDFWGVDLQ